MLRRSTALLYVLFSASTRFPASSATFFYNPRPALMADAAAQAHRKAITMACASPLSKRLGGRPQEHFNDWLEALLQRCATVPGLLESLNNVATEVAHPAPAAMGEAPAMTAPQFVQYQLRALIRISICCVVSSAL